MEPSLPAEPSLTAEEVGVAAGVAQELGVCVDEPGPEHPGADPVTRPLRSMEVERILEAAFSYRSHRFNSELRKEAADLAALVQLRREELEQIQERERSVEDVEQLLELTRRMLELLADEPILQAGVVYQQLQSALDNLDWSGEFGR